MTVFRKLLLPILIVLFCFSFLFIFVENNQKLTFEFSSSIRLEKYFPSLPKTDENNPKAESAAEDLSKSNDLKNQINVERPVLSKLTGACALDREVQSDVGKTIEPKYKLDPTRFLAVAGSRGPNNQIVSIRDSIYLAVALNRTLIIPPWFKHDRGDPTSNGSTTAIVPFHQRMDMSKIKSLISVIEPEDAQQACGEDGFDIIYRLQTICQKENYPRVQAIEEYYNFTSSSSLNLTYYCQNWKKQQLAPFETFPPPDELKSYKAGNFLQVASLADARKKLSSDHKCPVASYPYKCTPIMRQWHKPEADDGELSKAIFEHTQRPEHLEIFVDSFVRKYSPDKKFLSIHWRYDEKDWKNEQCKAIQYKLICDNFDLLSDSKAIADFLGKHLDKIGGEEVFDFIYIATPPSEMELIHGVQREFENQGRLKIVTQMQLIDALAENYANCGEKYEDLRFEILSLAEMEISITASTYYLSYGSSWSFNVAIERSVMGRGETISNTEIFSDLKEGKKL
ncbi:Oidioi.mRNA.OKI2018_I69.PAR.g8483.t1.cds [Oikopleura dioica]|uniref:GDP-fucose protein O-fucosyltransferase 2 n=1 Tax=Oikopleura dioica TaxID=34765 RepID=A0ABN7RG49_OIKDI|nr:Oidioi.mRNA.OKI2018_I69.PAR.g8483.t1.cds [Oikopleura dioica]